MKFDLKRRGSGRVVEDTQRKKRHEKEKDLVINYFIHIQRCDVCWIGK